MIRPKQEECFKNPAANAQESIPTSVVERDEESLIITGWTFYSVEHRVSFLVSFPDTQCSIGVWNETTSFPDSHTWTWE